MGGEVPIPFSVREVPSSVKDLIGMSCRVVRPNEVVTGEYNAKRINIYIDGNSVITDIKVG